NSQICDFRFLPLSPREVLMRMALRFWLAAGVIAALTGLVRADEQADAKAILDKAIKAQGGEEKLSKNKVISAKSKGKFYGFSDDGIDFSQETSIQPPDKVRM